MVNILQLPKEVLSEIIKLVPYRKQAAIVCKSFYEIVCEIEQFKLRMNVVRYKDYTIDENFLSIRLTRRKFSEIRFELKVLSARDVSQLKNILEFHGGSVTRFEFINASLFGINQSDFIDILNYMPKLKELKMVLWEKSLVDEPRMEQKLLHLFNLKRVEFFGSASKVLRIFTQSLPRHVLQELKFAGQQYLFHIWNSFISTQLSIKKLDITGHFNDPQPFQRLRLTHFRIVFRDEFSAVYQNFLKNLIQSQLELTHVDFLCLTHCRCMRVNSEILHEIANLENLESLKLNIDEIKSWKIQSIADFRKLKELEIDSDCETARNTIGKLALTNNLEVERLKFHIQRYEIPSTSLKHIARNFTNLKSLEIAFDLKHKINFFMQHFPNLVTLKVRYGDEKNVATFADIYSEDKIVHHKMKDLTLTLDEKKMIKVETFFAMRNSFPNLERLEVHSKFPFAPKFLFHLLANIHSIKSLTISSFSVRNVEKFSDVTIEVLKHLRNRLKFFKVTLRNVQNLSRYSVPVSGDPRIESCDPRDPKFSYLPLVTALFGYFDVTSGKRGDDKLIRNLELKSGSE